MANVALETEEIVFVRQERLGIVQQKAIRGAPDLVNELISPNDRPSDVTALETDYRNIGVPEIVFIDQQKRRMLVLRKRDDDYEKTEWTKGAFVSEAVIGFAFQVDWLFQEPLPNGFEVLADLLARTSDEG
jgi:Uma2 family endonuclease